MATTTRGGTSTTDTRKRSRTDLEREDSIMGGLEDIFEDLFEGIGRRRRGRGGYDGPRDDRREPDQDSGQRYCAKCGAQATPDAAFCGQCGAQLAPTNAAKVCSACGRDLEPGAKFCPACGSPVG